MCSGHTPVNQVGKRVQQVEASWQVSDQPVIYSGMPPLTCEDSTRRNDRKRSIIRSNGHDGGDSSVVEREGLNKARRTLMPSTAAEEVPGRDGSPVPPEPVFIGRESGIDPVQRLSHYKALPYSWAIFLGFSIALTSETSNLMLGQYFKRKREFVEIVAASGTGVGITLFSVLFKETIRLVGWRLGLQAATGVSFCAFLLGIFYRSASLYHPQRRAILHLKNQKKKQVKDKKKANDKPPYFDLSVLRMRSVQILIFASGVSSAGVYAPLFYLILDAENEGVNASSLIVLQTFLGFAYALGSIGFGVVIVRRSSQCLISRQYLCQCSFMALGVTILSLTALRGYYGYVLFMWLYGLLLGGAHYSLKMLTLEKVRARHFSLAWAFIQGGTTLPILLGIPIAGYINLSGGGSKSGYIFASIATTLGGASLFLFNLSETLVGVSGHDNCVSFPTTVESRMKKPLAKVFSSPCVEDESDGDGAFQDDEIPIPIPAPPKVSVIPMPSSISLPMRSAVCTCDLESTPARPPEMEVSHCYNEDDAILEQRPKCCSSSMSFVHPSHALEVVNGDEHHRGRRVVCDKFCGCGRGIAYGSRMGDSCFQRYDECTELCPYYHLEETKNFASSLPRPFQTRLNNTTPGRGVSFSEPEDLFRLGQRQQSGITCSECPHNYLHPCLSSYADTLPTRRNQRHCPSTHSKIYPHHQHCLRTSIEQPKEFTTSL